jgi:hypothetical protein
MKDKTDRQIENIIREIDGIWFNIAYKLGILVIKYFIVFVYYSSYSIKPGMYCDFHSTQSNHN